MGINQEIDVMKSNDGKKAVFIDDIIAGVQHCKIDNNVPKSKDISQMLMNLSLEDGKVKKLHYLRDNIIQPKKIDEKNVCIRSCSTAIADNLVKLDEPCPDDKEYDEENGPPIQEEDDEQDHEEEETHLEERGPTLGVAAANYMMEPGPNYIANKSYSKLYHTNIVPEDIHNLMPANFPVYNYETCRMPQDKGMKREIDDREFYIEPPKYVRPQNAGVMDMNTVGNQWNVPGTEMNSMTGKTFSNVYLKQLSGGTVSTAEDNNLPPTDDFSFGHLSTSVHLDINDFLEHGIHGSALDTEDFLPSSGPSSHQHIEGLINYQELVHHDQLQNKMNNGLQHWYNDPQNALPTVSQLTSTFSYQPQMQKFENFHQPSFHEIVREKRGSFGNDEYSDGYVSDLSPSHDILSNASPCSVMGGSPPQNNWSPPPSNMSHNSVDSGVCSPMADDQSGYSSMKSPRQGQSMSPHSMSSMPPTPQTKMISTSPPLQNMSPHTTYQPVAQDKLVVHNDDDVYSRNDPYTHPYINDHLLELDNALLVAGEDLMEEQRRKGLQMNTLKKNISVPISKINQNKNMNKKDVYSMQVTHPPQNFSVAVAPPFTGNNRHDISVTSNDFTNMANKTVTQNSSFSQKSQGYQKLPTSMPAIIPIINNTMFQSPSNGLSTATISAINFPPSANGVGHNNRKVSNINTVQVPHQSVAGKIAIAPIHPKKPAAVQSQMLPVFVTSSMMNNNGLVTPVLLMPQAVTNTTAPKKLTTLLPKEPTKQNEQIKDVKISQTNVSTHSSNNMSCENQVKMSDVAAPNGKKTVPPSKDKLLNLARRLVAEMSTCDLKYVDEDGDTYLHVAVCKADHFMLQALLERLERENLIQIINKQNSEGQTPLYLAVSINHTVMVQLIVEQGADVLPLAESTTPTGYVEKNAAIHCASTKGEKYLETLKALLEAPGINLNQVNSDGHTALICAILAHGKVTPDKSSLNSIPIIRALIQAGADLNFKVQQNGKTALMFALESRDLDLIESIFQLVDPQKLPDFLTTQAFDSSSCHKIAEALKTKLNPAGQQRLSNCLRPMNSRIFHGLSA